MNINDKNSWIFAGYAWAVYAAMLHLGVFYEPAMEMGQAIIASTVCFARGTVSNDPA